MAKKPAKAPMKEPVKAKPQGDGSPPKHLAYITEEEAKILDILLNIKRNAKGKDGKPLPHTFEPGEGQPTEFLTELTQAQINELLAKTDGSSETTEHGVESYADASVSGGSYNSGYGTAAKTASKTSTGTSGRDDRAPSSGTSSSPNNSRSAPSGKDGGDSGGRDGGMRDSVGANAPAGRDTDSSYGNSNDKGISTPTASGSPVNNPSGLPSRTSSRAATSELAKVAAKPETRFTGPNLVRPENMRVNPGPRREQLSLYRSPPSGVAADLVSGPGKTDRVTGRPSASSIPSGSELAGLVSGPGKGDRENVTTLTQNGRSPFGANVGFTQGTGRPAASSIPSASELATLVSGPGKGDRQVAMDPSIPGRMTSAPATPNVTTINRDPNGPMPQLVTDVPSELGRIAVGSQFNTPLADDPGAYNESELANAITGERPRAIGSTSFENIAKVRSDPTATYLANDNTRTILGDQVRPAPLGTKTDRLVPSETTVSTDRARSVIMGNSPIPGPESRQLNKFGNSTADALQNNLVSQSAALAGRPPAPRNVVPDSSLSTLATQKPDDFMAPVSQQERQLQPQRPVAAPTPLQTTISGPGKTDREVPTSTLRDVVESVSPEERALQPSQPLSAPAPIGGEDTMPDISYDANNVEETPAELGYEGTEAPATAETASPSPAPSLGGEGGTDVGDAAPVTEEPVPGEPGPTAETEGEFAPGIMPWDRQAYAEIAAAYQAAGQTYTPQQYMQAFYNVQPFTIERPPADAAATPGDMTSELYAGIMPWDRPVYERMRRSAETAGQTYTPQQFITQFYAPQAQAAA